MNDANRYYYEHFKMSNGFGIYGPDGLIMSVDDEDFAQEIIEALADAYSEGKGRWY
jgi:hypothetical protein